LWHKVATEISLAEIIFFPWSIYKIFFTPHSVLKNNHSFDLMKIVILSGNLIKDSNEKVVAEAVGKQAFKNCFNLIQKG
tara:strand:+ start:1153 stop:1389 length:237 start_codon:yes stop_codon:yes gene_type:complete